MDPQVTRLEESHSPNSTCASGSEPSEYRTTAAGRMSKDSKADLTPGDVCKKCSQEGRDWRMLVIILMSPPLVYCLSVRSFKLRSAMLAVEVTRETKKSLPRSFAAQSLDKGPASRMSVISLMSFAHLSNNVPSLRDFRHKFTPSISEEAPYWVLLSWKLRHSKPNSRTRISVSIIPRRL